MFGSRTWKYECKHVQMQMWAGRTAARAVAAVTKRQDGRRGGDGEVPRPDVVVDRVLQSVCATSHAGMPSCHCVAPGLARLSKPEKLRLVRSRRSRPRATNVPDQAVGLEGRAAAPLPLAVPMGLMMGAGVPAWQWQWRGSGGGSACAADSSSQLKSVQLRTVFTINMRTKASASQVWPRSSKREWPARATHSRGQGPAARARIAFGLMKIRA